jgi:putative endonuclease
MTNNLSRRLGEHSLQSKISRLTFTGKYKAVHLIYYEVYSDVKNAIERENRLKGWTRAKKNQLISSANPDLEFLSVT